MGVMKLDGDDFSSRAWTLGFGSALMIVSGYYGELVVTGDLTPRWVCWFASMSFFLYIVYELRWPCSCYRQRTQPRDRKEDWHSASDDGDQLVHVSNCVLVPNAWHFSCEGLGIHPAGLLRFRHYFQVRSRHRHLPNLLREVQQAVPLAMTVCMKLRRWHHFADFSSRTDTFP